MRVGVFTVGLPNFTPEEGAREIADAGYEGVEWRVTHVAEQYRKEEPSFWRNNLCTLEPTAEGAERVRIIAEREALQTVGLGTYIEVGDLKATEEAMRFAKRAGAPRIRVGVGKTGEASYADLLAASTEFLADVEALAREYGVKALVEIHHGTICPSAALAYRLVSRFDPAAVGVIYDPGNMVREGFEDYRIGTEMLGPYLAHVHLKNAAFDRPEGGGTWRARWAPLEDGVVDFDALFEALSRVGYDGWLVVEDFSRTRPDREVLRHNLCFVRSIAERL